MIVNLFIVSVTAFCAVTDIMKRKIPNRFIIPCILIGLVIQLVQLNILSIGIAILAYIIMITIYSINSDLIGGGDIYLITFLFMMFGTKIEVLLFPSLIYTVGLIIIYWFIQLVKKERQTIPLAVSLFAATLTTIF